VARAYVQFSLRQLFVSTFALVVGIVLARAAIENRCEILALADRWRQNGRLSICLLALDLDPGKESNPNAVRDAQANSRIEK
jgi:hypothetical protein